MLELLLSLSDESDYDKVKYLAETFYDELLVYASKNLRRRPIIGYDAEDAVQDTYVRVIFKINCLDFTRTDREIKKYIKEILNNIIADRREQDHGDLLIENINMQIASPDDFIQDLMKEYQIEAVIKALKALDDRYRVPLTLKYRDDYSVKKIAELLNKPLKTVYTNINRGLILLRKRLEEEGWGNE